MLLGGFVRRSRGRQAIVDAPSRLPINQGQRWGRLRRISNDLSQQLGREPSLEEIAKASELTVQQVEATLLAAREPVQIDEIDR